MAEAHPVGFQWVMEAKKRGAKVIHVDPRFTRTSALADLHVPIRAGARTHCADPEVSFTVLPPVQVIGRPPLVTTKRTLPAGTPVPGASGLTLILAVRRALPGEWASVDRTAVVVLAAVRARDFVAVLVANSESPEYLAVIA